GDRSRWLQPLHAGRARAVAARRRARMPEFRRREGNADPGSHFRDRRPGRMRRRLSAADFELGRRRRTAELYRRSDHPARLDPQRIAAAERVDAAALAGCSTKCVTDGTDLVAAVAAGAAALQSAADLYAGADATVFVIG